MRVGVVIAFYTRDRGLVEIEGALSVVPRENEHIFYEGNRYYVTQVQHEIDPVGFTQIIKIIASPV